MKLSGLAYSEGVKGGRLPCDPVIMFKVMIWARQNNLSDARKELMIRDRLSWMRFLGLSLGGQTPDENSNRLTETRTLKWVMKAFDWQLQQKGYIPMSGQIVDSSLLPARKQRNTEGERWAIKSGQNATDIWPDEPNNASQKDTNARWALKIGGKIRYREDGTPLPTIALPVFGYKSHISIDCHFSFIREMAMTLASVADGRLLRQVLSTNNTGYEVWTEPKASEATVPIAQRAMRSGYRTGCLRSEFIAANPWAS